MLPLPTNYSMQCWKGHNPIFVFVTRTNICLFVWIFVWIFEYFFECPAITQCNAWGTIQYLFVTRTNICLGPKLIFDLNDLSIFCLQLVTNYLWLLIAYFIHYVYEVKCDQCNKNKKYICVAKGLCHIIIFYLRSKLLKSEHW